MFMVVPGFDPMAMRGELVRSSPAWTVLLEQLAVLAVCVLVVIPDMSDIPDVEELDIPDMFDIEPEEPPLVVAAAG
jgi:hypothetical protein